MAAITTPSATTPLSIFSDCDPSAMRMPNSRVRALTENARTPVTPTTAISNATAANTPKTREFKRSGGCSTRRPPAQRGRKGFAHGLFGKIKITEYADQSCQDSCRIHAIAGVEQFADLLGGMLGYGGDLRKTSYPESIWRTADRCKVPRS